MPYFEKDGVYDRVTEWLNADECEETAYHIKKGNPHRPRMTNASVIPGTFLHHRISIDLHERLGLPNPNPPRVDEGFHKIINGWIKNGVLSQKLWDPVHTGYKNYQKFMSDYNIRPVFIEKMVKHTFYVDKHQHKLAGTVDLVALIWLKGIITTDDNIFHECNHRSRDPACQCEWMWVVTIIDWKSSTNPQANHSLQLSVYRWMMEMTGLIEIATEFGKYPMNDRNWSVLLDAYDRRKEPYHLIKYEPEDLTDFFAIGHIMADPKQRPRNRRTGHEGGKMRCFFCSEKIVCSENGVWTPKSDYDAPGAVVSEELEISDRSKEILFESLH